MPSVSETDRATVVKQVCEKHPNRIKYVAGIMGITARVFKRDYVPRMPLEVLKLLLTLPDHEDCA